MVESRFGIPILAIVLLFVPAGFDYWRTLGGRLKGVAIVLFLTAIAGGCWLSHWIQSLAEPIARAWQS
jgi:tellurite resistance protein TehA-like permease